VKLLTVTKENEAGDVKIGAVQNWLETQPKKLTELNFFFLNAGSGALKSRGNCIAK
jgi:hypothetical protein